jgi:aspartate/methionine/tyrosine aminotransferase
MPRFAKNGIISLLDEQPAYNLGESTAFNLRLDDVLTPEEWQQLRSLELGYGSSKGELSLRRQISEPRGLSSDQVLVTTGSIASLFLILLVLCESGQEVVTVVPSFPPILDIIEALHIGCRKVPLLFEHGYRCQPERIRMELNRNTRLVLLITPHNPSGVSVGKDEIEEVLNDMRELCPDAFLVIDETYREATYGSQAVPPSAACLSDRIISIASFSKCHGAPGIRIGWLTCRDSSLMDELTTAKLNTVISCSVVDEFAASRVLAHSGKILGSRRVMLAQALSSVTAWIGRQDGRLEWVKPHGGALCCVRLNPKVFPDSRVGDLYGETRKRGVQLAPGSWFHGDDRVFRLGFGFLQLPQLDVALEAVTEAVHALD